MSVIHKQKRYHITSAFASEYEPNCHYWEYITFMRRICVAVPSVPVTGNKYKMTFTLIMFLFSFVQHEREPFIINAGNIM